MKIRKHMETTYPLYVKGCTAKISLIRKKIIATISIPTKKIGSAFPRISNNCEDYQVFVV